jgi:hypothetical protein
MSVTGVKTSALDVLAARLEQAAARAAERQPARAESPAAAPPATASRTAPGGVAVDPPPGTDPELWSVLTTDERAFFATHVTNGPLTYSRIMTPFGKTTGAAPEIRGGRVDVRV